MSSYLYLPEPSWLTGPPEPSPRAYSGTCPTCATEHFNGPAAGLGDLTACACGEAKCCSECDRCAECGDPVCPQCSVNFSVRNGKVLICSGCHQTYLDDLSDEPEIEPGAAVEAPRNAHVHPALRSFVNAISTGVRA